MPINRLQPEMDLVGTRLMHEFPQTYKDIRLHTTHLGPMGPSSGNSGDLLPVAAVFLTLTGLIFILACVNVANLILVFDIGTASILSHAASLQIARLANLQEPIERLDPGHHLVAGSDMQRRATSGNQLACALAFNRLCTDSLRLTPRSPAPLSATPRARSNSIRL